MSITSKPGQVLMTADTVGGVWTYALDLSRGLLEAGVKVTLAVLGPAPSAVQASAAQDVDGLTLAVTGLPLDWLADTAQQVAEASRVLAGLASHIKADLVHLNSPTLAAGLHFEQPVLGACHSCLATWWDAAGSGAMPWDFRWRVELQAAGHRACDTLIAPSHAFAQATAIAYPGVQPVVVYNGRDLPPAARVKDRKACATTVGRLWDTGKNLAALDRAAALLAFPVLAIGPTRGPNGQQAQADHVQLLGALPSAAVAAHLANAAVFVSLATYEPFGLTVLEAAQAGCALVLADIPTFRELWQDAAVFVDPDAPQDVAAQISELLNDASKAALCGAAARRRAGRFTTAAMVDGTLAAYARLSKIAGRAEARVA